MLIKILKILCRIPGLNFFVFFVWATDLIFFQNKFGLLQKSLIGAVTVITCFAFMGL